MRGDDQLQEGMFSYIFGPAEDSTTKRLLRSAVITLEIRTEVSQNPILQRTARANLKGGNASLTNLLNRSQFRLKGGESHRSASCSSMFPASNAATSERPSLRFFTGKPASRIL